MAFTKCKLYVDASMATKLNISATQTEDFCFIAKDVFRDDLGMVSTGGKLVAPSTGDYRITATGVISDGGTNDYVYFGFDLLGSDGEGVGGIDNYQRTDIPTDTTGIGNWKYGCISDVVHLTAGQTIGCIYMRGSANTVTIKARCPMITIEKIG